MNAANAIRLVASRVIQSSRHHFSSEVLEFSATSELSWNPLVGEFVGDFPIRKFPRRIIVMVVAWWMCALS